MPFKPLQEKSLLKLRPERLARPPLPSHRFAYLTTCAPPAHRSGQGTHLNSYP